MYRHLANPVPVTVTRIFTAPVGTSEPTNTPSLCRVELFWQAMPGETVEEIDREFFAWLETMFAREPDLFMVRPGVEFPIRWLPGSAIELSEPLLGNFARALRASSVMSRLYRE